MIDVNTRYEEDKQLFVLTSDIITPEITVPAGFYSDGFTVPRLFRWYISRTDKGWYAAWVHDYCYTNAIKTKSFADKLFYKNLRRSNVSRFKAKIMYLAVSLFGRGNY